ncbi:PaaI family thioesterase [Nocardiopsis sp. LOL_012]|uniref:PaaI family thioesterase n=1 Tax=Nocardiopsis sp. LOL_012 TaxID=3345409 RepID=UPI003A861BA1
MTVNTPQAAQPPAPRDYYGLPVVEADALPDELRSLVARAHDLIEAVANTTADRETLAEATAAVQSLTDTLNAARREPATMVFRGHHDGVSEYGTITNIVSGDTNPAAPPLVLERTEEGVRGEVTLDNLYQGPPGCVHGGWIAALLDQAIGSASAFATSVGMTARLEVDYRRPTPLFMPLEITAGVERVEGRKVYVRGEIRAHGKVTAEARALMIQVTLPKDDS